MSRISLRSAVFVACSVYTVLRYFVFGTTPGDNIPLFLGNKAISWAALLFVGLAPFQRDGEERKSLGLLGFSLAGIHIVFSAVLLSPEYYGKLYSAPGRFTFWGELCILSGGLALVVLTQLAVASTIGRRAPDASDAKNRFRGYGTLSLALIATHCAALGWKSWVQPTSWPGAFPPISLLSFFSAVGFIAWRVIRKARRSSSKGPSRPLANSAPGESMAV